MTIRIGIVGCGRILAAHLQGYRVLRDAGFDDFRITALCARRAEDAEGYVRRGHGPPQRRPVSDRPGDPLAVADQYVGDFQEDVQPRIFTDYRAMIESGEVDAINDFTTHELHFPIASAAFERGLHVLTQKPLTVSVAAARQLCNRARENGCTFAVFENARNKPATRQLRWLVESQPLGRLKMIHLANIGNWWAPDLVVAETPWRHRLREGGGLALDIGVHLFNQFSYVAGDLRTVWGQASVQEPRRRIKSPAAVIDCDADDTIIGGFDTVDDVQGSFHLSWSGHGEPTMSGGGRGPCYYFEGGSVIGDDLQRDDGSRAKLSQWYAETVSTQRDQAWFPRGIVDPFALNQGDWLRAIQHNSAPETSGEVGARDLAAAMAILESSHCGRRLNVEDVLLGRECSWQERHGLSSEPE